MDVATRLRDAERHAYWLDDANAPDPSPPLRSPLAADLVVVGGGFTGLWAALQAKEEQPGLDVVVLEAGRCGQAASGRNGGFCAASLTHGLENGVSRFPGEIDTLERLGQENLDGIESTVARWNMDCHFERTGELNVATEPYQVEGLKEALDLAQLHGGNPRFLDREELRQEVHSPTYLAGLWDEDGCALVHPSRLASELQRACEALGIRFFEHTRVIGLEDTNGSGGASARPVRVRTEHGSVSARRVVLATNAEPSPIRRLRRYIVPVYDYVLMTEPLGPAQMDAIGWKSRAGIGGVGNQFLYYRLSADNRILFGGYDAIYHYGNRIDPALEYRKATFDTLVVLFDLTFPQLEGVTFTHAWAGAIDTCSRFCAFFDRSFDGRVASVAGYTGLGVGASRFGARVALDLVSGQETELTRLDFVSSKPIPFPPEPVRSVGIQMTRWSMMRADRNDGKRNLWLKALDRLGLGFDS